MRAVGISLGMLTLWALSLFGSGLRGVRRGGTKIT